ncbi:hypothetical protein [Cellvibrio sp. UBA7661]|uniref:hypothetical protein n=1 Tax=Cellvibrio sp. UBA7661 TaxID=1946311 RepID=UPI002F35E1F5
MTASNGLPFILGEIIFILLVACIFLTFIAIKFKKRHDEIELEYKELRKRTRHILNELNFADQNFIPEKLHGDTVGIFLHSITQYSIERFKKFVPGGIPSLSADTPFGAKIAALRYLVASAEAENRTKQNSPENWLVLEKRLADIVRWVRNMPKQQNYGGGRIKQLQEKIDSLKKQEVENSRLKRQLTLARQKSESLGQQNKSQRDSIRKLQTMINAFQRAFPDTHFALSSESDDQENAAYQRHERATHAYEGSVFQITNINDISQKKQGLLNQIAEDFNNSFAYLGKSEREKFEEKVKALELDILKSDHHITNLQKELKMARENIQQFKQVELDEANYAVLENDLADGAVLQEEHVGMASWVEGGGPQRSLEEIEKLRSNNQNQRQLILELNSEINVLRESMLATDDEVLKEEKGQEIIKLERLVKECEYCIETLESEVELLRDQMTDEQEKLQHPDIERLNRDIEHMSAQLHQTIEQCSKANTVNKFATQLLECNNIESIAQLLTATLQSMNVACGFYLNSDLGNIEHYSDGKGTPQEQKSLKALDSTSEIGYVNEGILFFRPHVRLIVRDPPDEDEAQALLETTLDTMVQLANSKIGLMDSQIKLAKHDSAMSSALHKITGTLTQIKSRHHAQSADAKAIILDFTREIELSVKAMKPSPAVKAVFDNAIGECFQRMDQMLSESKTIDKYTQDIIGLLEKK